MIVGVGKLVSAYNTIKAVRGLTGHFSLRCVWLVLVRIVKDAFCFRPFRLVIAYLYLFPSNDDSGSGRTDSLHSGDHNRGIYWLISFAHPFASNPVN